MSSVSYLTLKDLIQPPIAGKRPIGGVNTESEGIPSLGGENILATGGITYDVINRIPVSYYNLMPKGKVNYLDVLINKDGAQTGKIGLYEGDYEEAAINEHLFILRPIDASVIDPIYLYYTLLLPETQLKIKRRITGSAQPGLNSTFTKIVSIPYQPLKKQHKIKNILRTIDQTIEKTEALIHKYQQIKTGLMHDLFTRGITADGKLRPPREQAPELFKETPIGWIPKDWDAVPISSMMESLIDGPFGSNLKTEHYVTDPGVRVVRLQNIQATAYNDTDKAYISEKQAKFLNRNNVISGDILIAGLGEDRYPVGRACQYPLDLPPAINKADCFRLRSEIKDFDNSYIMLFLNTPRARTQVRKFEQGVTRPRINLGNMKKIMVPKPCLEEQKEISKRIVELSSKIEKERYLMAKYEKHKSGLMHDLLTGKVQVSVN